MYNFAGLDDGNLYVIQIDLVRGYLQEVNGDSGGAISPGDSTAFVFQPFEEAPEAGPDGLMSFLLAGSKDQALVVTFAWPNTSQPGAKVVTNQIPGFTAEIEDNDLNDPNQPSCSVKLRGQQ